jgi:hypothetical protein
LNRDRTTHPAFTFSFVGMRIRHIDISGTQMGIIGAASLKKVLGAPQCMIHHLNLADNSIGAPELDLILEGLKVNHSLTSLELSGNPLPPMSISRLLTKPAGVVLSRLYLSRIAAFGPTQSRELGELLRTNSLRFEVLDISDAPIDESAASYILQSVWKNKTLSALYMRNIPIAQQDMREVEARFERAFPLVVLEVDTTSTKVFASKLLSDLCASLKISARPSVADKNLAAALVQFPRSILMATQLQSLVLSHNSISEIPSAISKLSNLRNLDLRYNDLETLPPSMGQLTQLKHLKLLPGNNIRTPADERILKLAADKPAKLLGYLRDLEKGSEEIYRMKLMIVGQENVGKSA